jgi:multiple sugar transport system permease protein
MAIQTKKPGVSRRERQAIIRGLLFVSPWLVGLLWFYVYPFFASLYYSFHNTTPFATGAFTGLENYRLLLGDPLFWKSLLNTFYYTGVAVVLGNLFALSLALLLSQNLRGMTFYRTIFYLPSIVPFVAVSVVWIWILHPQYGIVNYALEWLGLPTLGWFSDPLWAMPGLIIVSLWGTGNMMIIYLAGLLDIPKELHEAATIDGATAWQRTLRITIPLLTPIILFNVVIGLIGGFQYFVQPYIITGGGPADATLVYALYLYQNAFSYFRMGYASAMAWVLFVIIMVVTLLVFRSSGRWVFYRR